MNGDSMDEELLIDDEPKQVHDQRNKLMNSQTLYYV